VCTPCATGANKAVGAVGNRVRDVALLGPSGSDA
jgi:hypothetical protein